MATMPNGMTTGSGEVQDHLDEDYEDVTAVSAALRALGWRSSPVPKDRPVFLRSAACVSVGVWSDEWQGWVAHADGFNARDHNGDTIVIDAPDYWAEIPELDKPRGLSAAEAPTSAEGVTPNPPEVS